MAQTGLGLLDIPADFNPSGVSDTSSTPWWVPLVQTGVMTAEQVIDSQVIPPPTTPVVYPVGAPYSSVYIPSAAGSITSSPLFWPVVILGAIWLFRRK